MRRRITTGLTQADLSLRIPVHTFICRALLCIEENLRLFNSIVLLWKVFFYDNTLCGPDKTHFESGSPYIYTYTFLWISSNLPE